MASSGRNDKNPDGGPQVCGALGCRSTDHVELVGDGNGRIRALCQTCAKDFLGVTT